MSKAEQDIPEERKKRAYIFLAATAGMRLLEYENVLFFYFLSTYLS
jgi:hypothetical protein